MRSCWRFCRAIAVAVTALPVSLALCAQQSTPAPSSSSSSAKHSKKSAAAAESSVDAGAVTGGVYRNRALGFSCKVPAGWVLRTDEMNAREGSPAEQSSETVSTGRVLFAAFSRPPEARAEDVNASILIAAESATTYPGLKEAVQYFGPLSEVAKAQGFLADSEPYEIVLGPKTLVREDFHKDIGTRVMRQSTLAMLAMGYAVSITVIAGTDEEVEDLIADLGFGAQPAGR